MYEVFGFYRFLHINYLKKQYNKAKIFASKALKYKNIKTLYKIRASDIINFK